MKRVFGVILAGLVGAGTLFSGVGVAHAEEESTKELVTEEQTQESTEANSEKSSVAEEAESSSESTVADSVDSSEPIEKAEEESTDGNSEAEYQPSKNDGLEGTEIEQVEYAEKVLSSYGGGGDGEDSSYPPPAESGVTRYTVLVIDDSGSMEGEPGEKTIAAAKRFCDQYFIADGTNYLAIVAFGNIASTKQAFTTSKDEAYTAIDTFSFYSGTNTNSGLMEAYSLTESIPSSNQIIKNIVILSDGLPESGDWDDNGEFTEQDNDWSYGHANAAVKTAEKMFNDHNIYSLGFFHSLDEDNLDYARRVMKALQNDGYYEVTDVNDLEFTFGEVAEEVTKNEEYPVIVVPGVLGSRLYNDKDELVWQDDLMKIRQINIDNTLYVKNNEVNQVTAKEKEYGTKGLDGNYEYKKLVDRLCDTFKYVYFFSYDWRKSNANSAEKLKEEIEYVKKASGCDKVNIVAHSMGGLVTSYYAKKYGIEGVNKIITCSTPYEGSPELLNKALNESELLDDDNLLSKFVKGVDSYSHFTDWLLGIGVKVRKKLPALAELAPTNSFYSYDGGKWGKWILLEGNSIKEIRELKYKKNARLGLDPDYVEKIMGSEAVIKVYEKQNLPIKMFQEFLKYHFNENYNKSVDFHKYIKTNSGNNILSEFDNTYFIVARGEKTIYSFATKVKYSQNDKESIYLSTPIYVEDGDGTVPYESENMCGRLNELGSGRVKEIKGRHGDSVKDEDALKYICDILSTGYGGENSYERKKNKMVQVSIMCPVEINVERNGEELSSENLKMYTSYGRLDFTGENGDIKSLCLTDDGYNYDIKLNGTDTGTMDLLLRWYDEESNIATEKTFYEIPVTEKTLMNFSLQEDGTSELYVDNDGDGIIDDTWYSAVGDVGYRIIEEGGESENSNKEEKKEENKETENKTETQSSVTERKESGSTAQPVNVVKKAGSTMATTKATTTGDSNYTALWISLSAAAAAAAIAAGVVYIRKRKSE